MAFNLPAYVVPTTGQAIPYWVINQISFNPLNSTIRVNVNGYISAAGYTAGMQQLSQQFFTISGATYQAFLAAATTTDIPAGTPQGAVLQALTAALQTNMLSLPFFSGATIVP